jgi:hypothetical protein
LVIEAAEREQAVIDFQNVQAGPPRVFVFPTGPHAIFSQNQYSFARIGFPGCPDLEAHLDLYVSGRSQVRHECDVVVLDRSEADFARQ